MKRFLSIIIALTMLLSVCSIAFAAQGQTGYSDIDGTGYETPVSILRALNIMSGYTDGSFHPYATITRAEMAEVALRMRGITDYGTEVSIDEVQYKDMDGHPAAAAVAYARSLGIIDGYEDGYFYPDDPVTYEQAVKMIVGAVGYDYYAVASGGYPSGYLQVASDLKLTSGVGLTVGSYITRGDVAKIVYNALTVDMMIATKYSGNSNDVTYEIVEGKNILNTYFDVKKVRGIVQENERTALNGESSLREGEVMVGGEIYEVGATNIDEYLGYYVTMYVIDDDSTEYPLVISYKVESSKNDYIVINAEDIDNVEITSTRYLINYWRNDTDKNTRSVKVSITPLVIYNGVAYTDFTLDDFNPDYGQLTLIDNDKDGVYDVVDILDYDIMLVLSSSSATGNVAAYPAYTTGLRSVKLEEDNDDYTVKLIDANGNRVSFDTITKNTVLSVAVSKDDESTVRTAIVSNDSVTGSITSITSDGYYVINDKKYDVIGYMKNDNAMAVGDSGTFFLSYDGRIAGFDGEQKLSRNIGLYISYNKGTLMEGGNVIKIMKADGTFGEFSLASKVKLNGTIYSGTEVFNMISATSDPLFGIRTDDTAKCDKIIADPSKAGFLYKTNAKGEISEIITSDGTTVGSETSAADVDSDYEIRCVVKRGRSGSNYNDSLYYSTKYHCFHRSDNKVYVTDGTVVMFSSDNYTKTDDSQIFWVSTPASMWNNEYFQYYEAYFYYVGNKKYADFAVFYDDYDAEGTTSLDFRSSCLYDKIRIVDRIVERYEDDDTIYRLMYWEGGSLKYIDFHEDYENALYRSGTTMWRRGDMVRFVKLDGKIGIIQGILSNNTWNDPVGNELEGGKNPDHKYKYPIGLSDIWGYYSERQMYYIGRVTQIDTLKYFSTINVQYGASSYLTDEPLEGDCYRLVYDNRGYIIDVDNVGTGAISEGQLILTRRQGTNGQISLRISESYILYEYEDIAESQELRETYSSIYPEFASV